MSEYLGKYGLEYSVRSQKFIRHFHLHIALKIQKELKVSGDYIHFELKMYNKNVDLAIVENNNVKLALAIRSQSSSIKKNFTNNVNSLQGEVVGLKSIYPNLKVGLVYLLKKTDIVSGEDLSEYYYENIPKKVLPLINTNIPTKDRFDAAMILVWDIDEKNNVFIDTENPFIKVFNEDTFIEDVKKIIDEEKLISQFTLKEIDKDKIREFLKENKK